MTTIRLGYIEHVSSNDAISQCHARHGEFEIDAHSAATIASWWQSPGTRGSAFAALASGSRVEVSALMADISHALAETAPNTDDRLCLEMLATWALNYDANAR